MNSTRFFKWETFVLVAGAVLLSPFWAHAAETCTVCPQVDELIVKMDKVAPDPMNDNTLSEQDNLSGQALEIVKATLNEKQFTAGNAKAIVKLISRTIPYDNSLDFERVNMAAFKRLYKKNGSLLKATIDQMQKSGELSTKDKKEMLELFGVIPSR
jgi:hypothetical protein